MAIVQERTVSSEAVGSGIGWSAVIAGGIVAAALSFVLLTFGGGIGLAISSTSPTWRDASTPLWVLSGAYLIFVALLSFGFGGYVAGRMRRHVTAVASVPETEFYDGMHGLLSWAMATVIGAVLAVAAAHALVPIAVAGGSQTGASSSVAGENAIAYELDQLFRSEHAPRDVDMTYSRAEAARILLTASGHSGVSQEDHDYLVRMVAPRAGLSEAEASSRVDTIIPRAHDALQRARQSSIMIAFGTAVALLIGAVVAWYSAREGGREREVGGAPVWQWALRRRARV